MIITNIQHRIHCHRISHLSLSLSFSLTLFVWRVFMPFCFSFYFSVAFYFPHSPVISREISTQQQSAASRHMCPGSFPLYPLHLLLLHSYYPTSLSPLLLLSSSFYRAILSPISIVPPCCKNINLFTVVSIGWENCCIQRYTI